MIHIIAFGEMLAEFMAERIDQRLDEPGSFRGPFPSGAPVIFADQAARQGARVKYIGHLGADAFGDAIHDRLVQAGVDVECVKREPLPTGTAFVTYASDGSRSFVFNVSASASGRLGRDSICDDVLQGCKYLHVMGSTLNNDGAIKAIDALLTQAEAFGVKVSFDPNVRVEMLQFEPMAAALRKVFERCHVFLPSETDLEFFYPGLPLEEAIAQCLLREQLEWVALKLGNGGCRYIDRNQSLHAKPFPVTEVDPTGAGDCFGGTFMAAIAQGFEPQRALHLANAAGALAVTRLGPMEGNSTPDQLNAFLQEDLRNDRQIA
ncbi:sugar kinase [Pseudomonas putida]|uniref:sugar kinase n=1 Tax=Pseudomonas putida TaxID=303 RepID=UPI0018D7BD43|nr:sugar kinase [Pseudomonas putida]MBH3470565.1 sugar kinase [Pseudomonas putida]